MHWSDGVHQFLELKHNLRMTPERMCDSFFSNVTLFKRYQPHLYGVPGTLGGKDARKFIESVYEIDTVNIPKYINSVFDIYQILIICETICDAEDVRSALISQHPQLKLYLRSDLSEHVKPEEVHSDDVILATNLAGRGTDLKTMTAVNDKGGLHVIVTFMPRNSRVEQQAFGRAGRQGQPGSARLVVYNENIALQINENMDETILIESWRDVRNQQEKSDMNEAITEVQRIEAKDRLLVLSHLIVHPKYFIYAGFHALCTNDIDDTREVALGLYKRALEIDSEDFSAHYNTIPCYIKNNQRPINEAIQVFDRAIKLLNVAIETRKLLEIFHDPPISDDSETQKNEPVDQTSLAELIYLQIVNSIFEQSREQLKQFDKNNETIICKLEQWPETWECLKGTKLEPLTNDIHAERKEWLHEGLLLRYVFVIQVKRCWWKTVFVFVMGVA
ncbi:unnamed protein product, partial [Didymodactylos carnosus]